MLNELRIRESQMRVFAELRIDAFRLSAATYLRQTFPEACAAYSDGELAAIVEMALERTSQYRINREADVLRWLNLMFALGFSFHVDPDLPWVREVLTDPGVHPDAIMRWLTERAIRHLRSQERA